MGFRHNAAMAFGCSMRGVILRASLARVVAQIELDWWQKAMDADFNGDGFRLRPHVVPCCNQSYNLDQLNYDWPQAFGRFGLEFMNPNVGILPAEAVSALETALGTSLRVIYAHL